MCDPDQANRPSFRSIFSNWNEYDASFATKVRLALKNSWIRVSQRQTCCGNHGEPGC